MLPISEVSRLASMHRSVIHCAEQQTNGARVQLCLLMIVFLGASLKQESGHSVLTNRHHEAGAACLRLCPAATFCDMERKWREHFGVVH